MIKIYFCFLFIITSIISCSVIAPGFNESNAEYTIVFSVKNLSGNTIIIIDDIDTTILPDKRTFIYTDKFSWIEDNDDEDNATMLEVVKYYLTTTINIYNLEDSLIETCHIEPSATVGDKISSITFEKLEIIINDD